jgi:hypothetical protein
MKTKKFKIMENYKLNFINPETSEKTEIETKISTDLVNKLYQELATLRGYLVTPALVNPNDKDSVVFGIVDMNDKKMKYKITISPNN